MKSCSSQLIESEGFGKMSAMLPLLTAIAALGAVQDEAWLGDWNASAGFETGLSLVALNGLRITALPHLAGAGGGAPAALAPPAVTVAREWGGVVVPDALVAPSTGRIPSRLWHPNVYLGVEYDTSFKASTTTVLSRTASALVLRRTVRLQTQQGWVEGVETHTFTTVSGGRLRYTMVSDRPNSTAVFEFLRPGAAPPTKMQVGWSGAAAAADNEASPLSSLLSSLISPTEEEKESRATATNPSAAVSPVYNVVLNDTWSIADGGVDGSLLLLSLQGLANRGESKLYLTYPTTWAYAPQAIAPNIKYLPPRRSELTLSRSKMFVRSRYSYTAPVRDWVRHLLYSLEFLNGNM